MLAADLASEETAHELGVALDVAGLLDLDLDEVAVFPHFAEHLEEPGRSLPLVVREREVARAVCRSRLRPDLDLRPEALRHAVPLHLRPRLEALALELVPVLHEHAAAPERRHQMLGDEV